MSRRDRVGPPPERERVLLDLPDPVSIPGIRLHAGIARGVLHRHLDRGCLVNEFLRGRALPRDRRVAAGCLLGPAGLARKPRLEACLAAAGREAAADGAAETGTQHLLLGLFEEGVAAAALDRLGTRLDAARAAAREMFPPGGDPGGKPPESAGAREAIAGAEMLARRAGCGYVGTEHLLGALALDPGSRARRVLDRLGVPIPAVKKELECYIGPARRRRRARARLPGWRARSAAGRAPVRCGWSAGPACTSARSASACAPSLAGPEPGQPPAG